MSEPTKKSRQLELENLQKAENLIITAYDDLKDKDDIKNINSKVQHAFALINIGAYKKQVDNKLTEKKSYVTYDCADTNKDVITKQAKDNYKHVCFWMINNEGILVPEEKDSEKLAQSLLDTPDLQKTCWQILVSGNKFKTLELLDDDITKGNEIKKKYHPLKFSSNLSSVEKNPWNMLDMLIKDKEIIDNPDYYKNTLAKFADTLQRQKNTKEQQKNEAISSFIDELITISKNTKTELEVLKSTLDKQLPSRLLPNIKDVQAALNSTNTILTTLEASKKPNINYIGEAGNKLITDCIRAAKPKIKVPAYQQLLLSITNLIYKCETLFSKFFTTKLSVSKNFGQLFGTTCLSLKNYNDLETKLETSQNKIVLAQA